MLKLYKLSPDTKEYWETWENNGIHTVHWGVLGTRGDTKKVKSTLLHAAEQTIQGEIDRMLASGFCPIGMEDHFTLLVQFEVDGMGTAADVEMRHRLEDHLNETLGWTGLGVCDGGSIGSGTMEVCNFVVDFDLAKAVIENDLKGTEFAGYQRIFDEDA
jgi:hypothetical protein